MNSRIRILLPLLVVLALGLTACGGPSTPASEPLETITLGAETSLLPATVWVAEHEGFFREEGLEVEIRDYDSGRNALKAMLAGEDLDVVTAAQTPIVFNSFDREDFALFATMVSSFEDLKLAVRVDRGISAVADLKGKRIGVTLGSTGHFYLALVLAENDLAISDVELVDLNASELPVVLAEGQVDAITTWEPHIYNVTNALGDDVTLMTGPPSFREDFYFVAMKGWLAGHEEAAERFVRAVIRAEAFIEANREESITIVAERLNGGDEELVAALWDKFEFGISLDQTLLTTLEDEARWALAEGYTTNAELPNYLGFVDLGALDEVKPEAVTIIR